jgi:hypothetical protein
MSHMTISHRSFDRALLWLGIATWTATVCLTVACLWLRVTSPAPPLPNRFGASDAGFVGFGFLQLACATIGLLIIARLPRNLVAWLLFGIGLSYAIGTACAAWAFAAAARPGSGGVADAAWLNQFAGLVPGLLTIVLILVYPQPLRTARSRALVVVAAVTFAFLVVLMPSIHPGPLFFWPSIENPFGVGPTLPLQEDDIPTLMPVVGGFGWLVGCAWIVWRYRRSERLERIQLKWFATAALASVAALGLLGVLGAIGAAVDWWPMVLYGVTGTFVPVAIGIAILRYHLYAIDRLINRALVYGAVTGLLVVVYVLMVVVTSSALAGLTNQGASLAVAVSTLTVAGLFDPVRRRIQTVVDRRFYRARYDATLTVDAFGERLRRTLDLEAIEAEMLELIDRTLQPVTSGLWLDDARTRRPAPRITP